MTSSLLSNIPKRKRKLIEVKQDKSAKTFKYEKIKDDESEKKLSWWKRLVKNMG